MEHEPKLSGEKICSKCLKSKPVIAFAVDKKAKDGLKPECRECDSIRNKKLYRRKQPKFVPRV